MNAPLKRLAIVVMAMFALLMLNANYLQAVDAENLNSDDRNRRKDIGRYDHPRGAITAGKLTLADSKELKNSQLKYLRTYSNGKVYAPVTGFFSRFSASGLELSMNGMLDGSDPSLAIHNFIDTVTGEEKSGATVETTLNPKAQQAAWNGMQRWNKGAVVALEPETGKILAMVSKPSYDPNPLASHDVSKVTKADKALETNDKPKLNRTIEDTYAPGSVFKVVTAAAAIEEKGLKAESIVEAPQVLDLPGTSVGLPNSGGSACGTGRVRLQFALERSCNTPFGKLAMDMGGEKLIDQAKKFGVGEEFNVPMRAVPSNIPSGMEPAQVARAGIGQESDQMTPMQMAMVAAAVANKGTVMVPNVVNKVVDSDGQEIKGFPEEEFGEAISEETAAELTRMMTGVVQQGTGTDAQIPGVQVAGKSGTAQTDVKAGRDPHAWFMSFAPAQNPKVAVAVLVESGAAGSEASGGHTAAPIAREVMKAVLGK